MSADTAKDGLDFTTQRFLALVGERNAVRGMVVELEALAHVPDYDPMAGE